MENQQPENQQPVAEKLNRPGVPALDEILGQAFPVLDDGMVRVVDYMGDDNAVVQAARVSYGDGTKKVSGDRGLIRYLLQHRHTTPFEMCSLKLHLRVPMDAWRQWIRHRTASVNEYSTRYSVAINASQETGPEQWRTQAVDNKQGSGEALDPAVGGKLTASERELHELSRHVYQTRIDAGVAREQARKDLPLCTYTEAYWKIDLHNLLHFLALRMDSHAQKEIRDYATIIGEEIVSRWVPMTWEAFQDFRFQGMNFSRIETEIVAALGANDLEKAKSLAEDAGWLKPSKKGGYIRSRERMELEVKLEKLHITWPW